MVESKEMRECVGCGESKPLDEYSASSKRKWRRRKCKACRATYRKRGHHAVPPPDDARVALRITSERWLSMKPLEREYAVMLAEDIVSVGVLTEKESRQARPDAWCVIDGRARG